MQDNNSVFFSIIIATKNRQYSINNTLKSLKDQTFKNFEVIVVNDYSDYEYKLDEKIISELNFKFLDNKYSAGRSAARNYALNFVEQSSQYYIFLDDDDYLDKTYLMNVYNKIIETSDCNIDIFYSNYQKIYLDFYEDNYREYKREYITTSEFDIELLKVI
ncbi:MAG TPA: glycosyltransferase family 2 protein [bacterium]|nr:glycosyltransferase family 2 protein [bacterium]